MPLDSAEAEKFVAWAQANGKSKQQIFDGLRGLELRGVSGSGTYTPLNPPTSDPTAEMLKNEPYNPTPQENTKMGIMGALSGAAGFAAGGLVPGGWVAKQIAGGIGAGMGQEAGRMLPPNPQPPDVKAGLQTAAITAGTGLGLEGGLRGITRGMASMGGVQEPAVNEALSAGPFKAAKTVFSKPSTTAEADLARPIAESLQPRNVGLTEGRITTQSTMDAMQAQNQGVNISDTMHALNDAIDKLNVGGIGGDAKASVRRLSGIRAELINKYLQPTPPGDIKGGLMGQEVVGRNPGVPPRYTIDPQEADYINQQIQDSIGNAYGKPGGKESIRTLKNVGAVHTQSFRAQTGTQESAAATQKKLAAYEAMRKQVSETTPESFVRGVGNALMTQGESGDQSALIALREIDPSGKLESQINTLASQREWTGSQSRIAHNIKFEFIRRLPRAIAKLTAVASKPIGRTGAATAAFLSAMDQASQRPSP